MIVCKRASYTVKDGYCCYNQWEKITNPQIIKAFASNSCAIRMTLFLHRRTESNLLILLPKAISRNSWEQPTPFVLMLYSNRGKALFKKKKKTFRQ